MQKIYEGCLRVTFGQHAVTIRHISENYRIAGIPMKDLHFLTLLADLTSPDGDYARSKFDSADKCHASICDEPVELGAVIVHVGKKVKGVIRPFLVFKNSDGTKSRTTYILDPHGSAGELSSDLLKHLGKERCHCRFCEDVINNIMA